MSVTDWWLGVPTTDETAVVVCRSDSTGPVTITYAGQPFTGIADTSINDGVVAIEITGVADTRQPYLVDGVAGGTLRARKGSGPWYVASGSCWQRDRHDGLAMKLLEEYDLDLYVALGDFPYANSGHANLYGISSTGVTGSLAANQNATFYLEHHRQTRRVPGIKDLMRSVPFLYMPDDHEYPYDNACPPDSNGGASHLLWRAGVTGAGAGTYAEFQAAWAAATSAIDAYCTGNPANPDAGIDADAQYTRFKLGPMEIFLLDACRYRTAYNATDDASKTMLGANQKAWAKAKLPASTASFKAIFGGKQFFQGGGNGDTWLAYVTERNELLYGWRNVVGMFAVSGDQHYASDQYVEADALGAGYPAFSCLVGCPTNVNLNPTSVTGYPVGIAWKLSGRYVQDPHPQENVVALLKVEDAKVSRFLYSSCRGLIHRGYIEAGSNQVQYPQQRFG